MISSNPFYQRARNVLFRIGSWLCFRQMFDPLALALGALRDMTVIGAPLAKVPYRGGIENKGVLDSIRSAFGPSQLLLKHQDTLSDENIKSIAVNLEGTMELRAQGDNIVEVKQKDLVIFCTGQRREHVSNSLLDHVSILQEYSQCTDIAKY